MKSRIFYYSQRRNRTESSTKEVFSKQEHESRVWKFRHKGRDPYVGSMLIKKLDKRVPGASK